MVLLDIQIFARFWKEFLRRPFYETSRKVKHIPPPLDLNARTLVVHEEPATPLPKSPSELPRECLPLRKRALVEVRKDLVCKSPKSSGFFNPSSPLRLPLHPSSHSSLTPCSANSHSSNFTQFPLPPPPLIPPSSVAVAAAAAAAVAISSYPKSPYLTHVNGFPTPPTELHSPYPWSAPLFSPFSTFSTSALLSPVPSYPSSTNSSREELPPLGAPPGSSSLSSYGESDSKRRFLSTTTGYGSSNRDPSGLPSAAADSTSPVPSSPLLSPRNWSHTWPTPIWQCFVGGTLVKFLIPNIETPWQTVEDLNWKDRLALKVDSKNSYQYAPDGLTIVKMDVINREISGRTPNNNNNNNSSNGCGNNEIIKTSSDNSSSVIGGSSSSGGESVTILRLRMAPHRGDNSPEILAECSLDHPFFVKEKGWSSGHARFSIEKYGIPCQELSVGDVCLPPNHPEAVRTPDLCDRFRRFEFSAEDIPSSPLNPLQAISVLLGEAWKSLPQTDRESYSSRAKVLADEQKKIYPDCWKRKRTLTSNGSGGAHPSTPTPTSHPGTPTLHHSPQVCSFLHP
ncbi:HBP1 [Lepeophtheirus salmonis]|uniref:HBP1 n=1 Tax=Lepeophtheirus salmonis TaxID=72036 RepID=A0A7R8D3R0_LEPSM|nr:HBP1 [Lepeophtheirus salmonis]CAF3016631.1 HBP1 [Lepeophtheirus salmonis]